MSGKKKVIGPCKSDCMLLISNHIRVVTQKCGPIRIGNNFIILIGMQLLLSFRKSKKSNKEQIRLRPMKCSKEV